jgi:hypothetical protein
MSPKMVEHVFETAVETLLDAAWMPIAASGWNRYQQHGRGALLASMSMLERKSNMMNYVTPSDQAPLPDWLSDAVCGYDPQTSVVLVFIEDDVFGRASGPVTRPDLREEYLGLLSGQAYFRVVARAPSPPECARQTAH